MGYLRYLPSKNSYIDHILELKVGMTIEPKKLISKLINSGYCRDTVVSKTGEIAVRGFVVDIFPVDEENPYVLSFLMMRLNLLDILILIVKSLLKI